MGEVVNVVVAFAVIVLIVRWAIRTGAGSEEAIRARNLLGFKPKNVSEDMISTVHQMFPDIPRDNIRYDLLRTGSVTATSNKILEAGFLAAPPRGYFQLFPAQATAQDAASSSARQTGGGPSSTSASQQPKTTSLIARFQLEQRLREEEANAANNATSLIDPGGKASWEETPERREASLRERKAQMVLAARKRFLEQQQQKASTAGS